MRLLVNLCAKHVHHRFDSVRIPIVNLERGEDFRLVAKNSVNSGLEDGPADGQGRGLVRPVLRPDGDGGGAWKPSRITETKNSV